MSSPLRYGSASSSLWFLRVHFGGAGFEGVNRGVERGAALPGTVASACGRMCRETCHSAHPTDDVFRQAQAGVMFDTPEQIEARAQRILVRAVQTRTMPLGNKTGMTDEERALIGAWIEQGARIGR